MHTYILLIITSFGVLTNSSNIQYICQVSDSRTNWWTEALVLVAAAVVAGHEAVQQQPVCKDAQDCCLVPHISWKALFRGTPRHADQPHPAHPLVAALHHAQPRVRCQARRAHGGTCGAIWFCRHRRRITYFFNFLVLFCWLVSVGFSLVRVDMIGDAVLLCPFDLSCCTVRVKVSDCNRWHTVNSLVRKF